MFVWMRGKEVERRSEVLYKWIPSFSGVFYFASSGNLPQSAGTKSWKFMKFEGLLC